MILKNVKHEKLFKIFFFFRYGRKIKRELDITILFKLSFAFELYFYMYRILKQSSCSNLINSLDLLYI